MTPFTTLTGRAIPFGRANVDTDLIIPARFLTTVGRTGLGVGAFAALRETPDNVFDRNPGAPILIAGDNFGCGSSREHAPWALLDLGIKVVIAPSFADIFASNAGKNGILLVRLPQPEIDRLLASAELGITIDLENQVVTTPFQERFRFEIDPFTRDSLLVGRDEIALTLEAGDAVSAYEAHRSEARAWAMPPR